MSDNFFGTPLVNYEYNVSSLTDCPRLIKATHLVFITVCFEEDWHIELLFFDKVKILHEIVA